MRIVENVRKTGAGSLLIIILGIILMFTVGPNYGIDFTGGTIIHLNLKQDFESEDIRAVLDEYGVGDSPIMKAGDNNQQVIIKMGNIENEEAVRADIINDIIEKYDINIQEGLLGTEKVGPAIGRELTMKALAAIFIACIGMLIYITYRFELMSGLAAIVALIHDVLIMFAFITMLRVQINSAFVAALLTIIGYSINDTIVVFDRIRENAKKMKKQKWSSIVNTSIMQTLVRSINTSVTTLIAITLVYLLGVPSIREFALPLIIGFISGTYSSIFIASPIWALWNERRSAKGQTVYTG